MRRPFLQLLCVVAASQAAQYTFKKLPDVLTATPSLTLHAGSSVACSSRCSRVTYEECTGYSFADNGTCWLFPLSCLPTEPSDQHPGVVSYAKPVQPSRWCPAGNTLAIGQRCYTHWVSEVPLTWYAAQEACRSRDLCSHLATPSKRQQFLGLFQFNRPNAMEWIGAEDLDGDGVVKLIDGSLEWTPALVSLASAGPILMPDGYRQEIHRTTPVHPDVYRYVCEYRTRCRAGAVCPTGWFLFNNYCYQHITETRTWHEADAHCATLGPNGHLASPWNNAIWSVLWQQFFGSSGGHVYMGGHDIGHEGSWRTLDGGSLHVTWLGGQPENAGGNENCLEMIGNRANDLPCDHTRQSICRVDAQLC